MAALVPSEKSSKRSQPALWVTSFAATDVFDDTGRFASLEDLVGKDRTTDDYQAFIDFWYLTNPDATIFPVANGEWAMTRDTENTGRGDKGSIKSRRDSVARSGVLCTRGGPFLFEDRNEANVGKYDVGHWGTLFEGMHVLWKENPRHPSLQKSIVEGIHHAKIYTRETLRFARRWVKKLGNAESDVTTLTTPLEIWASTEETEAAFAAHKYDQKFTVKSLGSQALWEDEKYKIASSLYKGRWANKTFYTNSVYFVREALGMMVKTGPHTGKTLWAAVQDACIQHADFSDPLVQKNVKNIIMNGSALVRCLKKDDHYGPEAIVDIILLMVASESSPLGQCSLLPKGVPLLDFALSDEDIKDLLRPLKDTQTFSSMREGGKLTAQKQAALMKQREKQKTMEQKQQARAALRAASKAAAASRHGTSKAAARKLRNKLQQKQRRAIAGSRAKPETLAAALGDATSVTVDELEALKDADADKTWLQHLKETQEYLNERAPDQASKTQALRFAGLRAALGGSITLFVNRTPRVIKSWLKMRLTFKASIYKKAKLQVRPSDVDATADLLNEEVDTTDGPAGIGGADDVMNLLLEGEGMGIAERLASFLSANDPSLPIACHHTAMKATNDVVLKMMTEASTLLDLKAVAEHAARYAAEEAIAKIPANFCELARLLDLVKDGHCPGAADSVTTAHPSVVGVSEKLVEAMRYQLFFFILKIIGSMKFAMRKADSADITSEAYLPKHVLRVVSSLADRFNISGKGKESFDKEPRFLEEIFASQRGKEDNLASKITWLFLLGFQIHSYPTGCNNKILLDKVSWVDVVVGFVAELYDCHVFIEQHDGENYRTEMKALSDKLQNMKAQAMNQVVKSLGVKLKVTITRNIELFPSERANVIAEIHAAAAEKEKEKSQAASMYDNTENVVLQRLVEKYAGTGNCFAASGSGPISGGPQSGASNQMLEIGPPTIHKYWEKVIEDENPDTAVLLKAIVSKANSCISQIMLEHVAAYMGAAPSSEINGLAIRELAKAAEEETTEKAKKVKFDVVRFEMANPSERKDVKLPFWGQVIDKQPAASMNHSMCLPLGNNNSKGPILFVEGYSVSNIRRSDACVAWGIPPLPKKAQPQTQTLAPDVEAEADTQTASPLAKKAKIEKKKDPSQKASAKPQPTHIVDWMDMTLTLGGSDYHYTVPYLKDNPQYKDVFNEKCYRLATIERNK